MKEEFGLQGMRGWAAMMVMYYHNGAGAFAYSALTSILWTGNSGVIFFFVISGYILTKKLLAGDYNVKDRFNAFSYYIRRVFRIWPLYFLALPLIVYGLHSFIVWQDLLFLQGYFQSTFPASGPLWTILIEELFYLIFPIWILLFMKNWKVSVLAAFLVSAIYVLSLPYSSAGFLNGFLLSQFPTYAIAYALGTVAAFGKKIKMNGIAVVFAWLFVSLGFPGIGFPFDVYAPLMYSFAYFLILCNMGNSFFFTNKISQFLGSLTYPIYIFGLPVEWFMQGLFANPFIWIPLTFSCTIALSYVLHIGFEKPLINFGRRIETSLKEVSATAPSFLYNVLNLGFYNNTEEVNLVES